MLEDYVTQFWHEIHSRVELTDLTTGPTSFSEAPAESVFSVYENAMSGRYGLTVGHCVALVRVAMEGPEAPTNAAYMNSIAALEKWPSHLGERYFTQAWKPGVVSKAIQRIQNNTA